VYLDKIIDDKNLPISLGIVKLILTSPEKVKEEFPKLVEQVEQIHNQLLEQKILDFIETVLFYKFTNMSREEVATMFSLDDIRGTKLYQELYEEAKVEGKAEGKAEGELLGEAKGKLEAIRGLLTLGLGVEQIAQALGVEKSIVERVAGGEVVTPESLLGNNKF
jgi:predicted transposase/invertase (TIGR01784 family)